MFIVKAVAKSKFQSVRQSVRGGGNDEEVDGDLDERGGVKWYEYNWPPGINVIHYNPWHGDDIPLACKKTASVVYVGYRLSVLALVCNVGANVTLAAMGFTSTGNLILSIFQFMILTVVASLAFYWHYRGMAGEIRKEGRRYVLVEMVLLIVYVVFIIVDYNNIHGFAAFGGHTAQPTTQNVTTTVNGNTTWHTEIVAPSGLAASEGAIWNIMAVSEASLWSLTLLFSFGGLWRVYRYPGHTIAFRREQPVTTRKKKGRASDLTATL